VKKLKRLHIKIPRQSVRAGDFSLTKMGLLRKNIAQDHFPREQLGESVKEDRSSWDFAISNPDEKRWN
jgi:hypothetical protein